ncbi:MAG: hypothetical protein ABMA26_25470, partial [Limisphaerales bacterium]
HDADDRSDPGLQGGVPGIVIEQIAVGADAEHGLALMLQYTKERNGRADALSYEDWLARRMPGTGSAEFRKLARKGDWTPVHEVRPCERDERKAPWGQNLKRDYQAFAKAFRECQSAFKQGQKNDQLFALIIVCCQRGRTVFMQWDCEVCCQAFPTQQDGDLLRTFADCQELLEVVLAQNPAGLSSSQMNDATHYLKNMRRRQQLCGVFQQGLAPYVRQRDVWLKENLEAAEAWPA